jgi:hypothetical protein
MSRKYQESVSAHISHSLETFSVNTRIQRYYIVGALTILDVFQMSTVTCNMDDVSSQMLIEILEQVSITNTFMPTLEHST